MKQKEKKIKKFLKIILKHNKTTAEAKDNPYLKCLFFFCLEILENCVKSRKSLLNRYFIEPILVSVSHERFLRNKYDF